MSNQPWQPTTQPSPPDHKRPVLALAVLFVAVAGLTLLGLNYGRGLVVPLPALPSPTLTTLAATTPVGSGGLNGPESGSATSAPTQEASITATPLPNAMSPAESALEALAQSDVPARDLYAIAERLKLKTGQPIPHTTDRPAGDYKVGHSDTFFISDLANKRYYTVTATIQEVTDHAYWYAQDGRSIDQAALKRAAKTFDDQIYPTNHRLFGSEWSPGVDNDSRITVLFVSIPGAGGYFSSADEYTRIVNPFSNEREIIYINADGGLNGVESTLAHEFQHMIHWYQHANHDVWINEGASVLAMAANGSDIAGVDGDFMREPDTQLNSWQPNANLSRANYGAAFLFLDYLRSHYGGDDMIRAVVAAPGQGTEVIDHALASMGRSERFADVFEQWTLANLLDTLPGGGDPTLTYPDREVSISPQDKLTAYPSERDASVSQFGADYIELQPQNSDTLTIEFSGQPETPVITAPAHSGQGIWWSNRGDLIDSYMTRSFDLRGTGVATLNFSVWMDTESDLDYGYVEASTDGGVTWDTLQGKYTTATNPNGANFGNGYTGKSKGRDGASGDGWLQETIDLGKYTGKETVLRFEYITDDGYNAGGVAVDDISIPEVGYSDSAEADRADGWQTSGFVRLANKLLQSYYLALVKIKAGGFEVQPVKVSPEGKATVSVEGLGSDWDRAVLVVAGTTPHNIQQAEYHLQVSAGP